MKYNNSALLLLITGFLGLLSIHIFYCILATGSLFLIWHSYLWDYEMISVYVLAWILVCSGAIQFFLDWKSRKKS